MFFLYSHICSHWGLLGFEILEMALKIWRDMSTYFMLSDCFYTSNCFTLRVSQSSCMGVAIEILSRPKTKNSVQSLTDYLRRWFVAFSLNTKLCGIVFLLSFFDFIFYDDCTLCFILRLPFSIIICLMWNITVTKKTKNKAVNYFGQDRKLQNI